MSDSTRVTARVLRVTPFQPGTTGSGSRPGCRALARGIIHGFPISFDPGDDARQTDARAGAEHAFDDWAWRRLADRGCRYRDDLAIGHGAPGGGGGDLGRVNHHAFNALGRDHRDIGADLPSIGGGRSIARRCGTAWRLDPPPDGGRRRLAWLHLRLVVAAIALPLRFWRLTA